MATNRQCLSDVDVLRFCPKLFCRNQQHIWPDFSWPVMVVSRRGAVLPRYSNRHSLSVAASFAIRFDHRNCARAHPPKLNTTMVFKLSYCSLRAFTMPDGRIADGSALRMDR